MEEGNGVRFMAAVVLVCLAFIVLAMWGIVELVLWLVGV